MLLDVNDASLNQERISNILKKTYIIGSDSKSEIAEQTEKHVSTFFK